MKEHKIVSPFFKPREILKLQFFKVHNKAPSSDDEYLQDTRFFSPKQTRLPTDEVGIIISRALAEVKDLPIVNDILTLARMNA